MNKGRELFALEWVKGEILGTLTSARQALEAYAEFGQDETRMRTCLTGLHQVHGSLVMLELPGVALLADHLERLAQAVLNRQFPDDGNACQLLMQGILELPVRLERIQAGHPDNTANAHALVNPIRTLLGMQPLEAPRPVQFEAGEAALARFERIDGANKIRRIRAAFQGVLLGLLKGESPPNFLDTLRKVGHGLERICEDTPSAILWQCFSEFVESQSGRQGPVTGDAIRLLRRVDAEIRRFGQEGVEAILAPVPEKLLQQLLDSAEANGRQSERLASLRSRLVPVDDGELIASGREALLAASHALADELAVVKDQIDLLVRSESRTPQQLADLVPGLARLASTCSLLGFESSRVAMLDVVSIIERVQAGTVVSRDTLFGIASALVQVEENFKAVSTLGVADALQAGVSGAERQVVAQARFVLDGIKQAVVGFVGNGFDKASLAGVPERLHDLAAVLAVAGLVRPSDLLDDCRAFLSLEIAGYHADAGAEQWERLDRFADCLSGIDYHLERIESNAGTRADDILDIVERNLTAAGFFGRGASTPLAAVIPVEALVTEGSASVGILPAGAALPEETPLPQIADPVAAVPFAAAPASSEDVAGSPPPEPHEVDREVVTIAAAGIEVAAVTGENGQQGSEANDVLERAAEAGASEPGASSGVVAPGSVQIAELAEEPVLEVDPVFSAPDEPIEVIAQQWMGDVEEAGLDHVDDSPAADRSTMDQGLQGGDEREEQAYAGGSIELRDVAPEAPSAGEDEAVLGNPASGSAVSEQVPAADISSFTAAQIPSSDQPPAPQAIAQAETGAEVLDLATSGDADAVKAAEGLPLEFDLSDTRFDALEQLTGDELAREEAAEDEIRNIFMEEAEEVLGVMAGQLDTWRIDTANREALREIRRGFHTLKGSGRVAGAAQAGELAWAVENMLNRVIDGTIEATPDFVDVATDAAGLFPELLKAYAGGRLAAVDRIAAIVESADVLASGGSLSSVDDDAPTADDDAPAGEELGLFINELQENVALLRNKTGRRRVQIDEDLLMALHTTVGSAGLVGEAGIARLFGLLDEVARAERAENLRGPNVEVDVARLFRDAADQIDALIPVLVGKGSGGTDSAVNPDAGSERREVNDRDGRLDELINRATELLDSIDSTPAEEALLGLAELDVVLNARDGILDWGRDRVDGHFVASFIEAMHAVLGATFRPQITDIAKALLTALRALDGTAKLPAEAQDALIEGCDRMLQVVDAIAADRVLPRVDDVVTRLSDLATSVPADMSVDPDDGVGAVSATVPGRTPAEERLTAGPAAIVVPAARPAIAPVNERFLAQLVQEAGHMDPDLAEIFFEESEEILESLDASVQGFVREEENLLHLENILRGLHTLKGSSRLAGLSGFGDRVHQFESLLSALHVGEGTVSADIQRETQAKYDEIASLVQTARDAFRRRDVAAGTETTEHKVTGTASEATPVALHPVRQIAEHRQTEAAPAIADNGPDMVRVQANLLENLVNLAGESSILRARVEQGISDFTASLDEMETTIERLSEQLRRLEIETDAQVLFRVERPDRRNPKFDPLEMDRYSQLQQLTRALSESASDMRDLKDTLLLRSREAETILLQQARVNTELQEGLMRTRMVPFNRLLPRLNRIVRQVAAELGKDVEFRVFNAEGELDRNLLERMVPPLEHMLRNAVDHGIEANNVRRSFGKSVPGRIDLRLSREGGDIVIEIGDDGMGIDVESVRAKAMERGLMRPDAKLTDEEVLDFVLAPGFSTAKSVTQISGRGVGLDVVNSEVKQLGGSVSIFSTPGKGTRFVLRVPFTVSVNRALMVTVGDDQYAIPLNTIEGIVLVDAKALLAIYASEDRLFEYAGLAYRVRYLGRYLGREEHSSVQRGGVPLVLVRAGEQSVAIAVDAVQGSREIVVKSLGPQFAGVGGISGATILGDGSVVIILDLVALIRSQGREVLAAVSRDNTSQLRSRCVMVVDDSVTVRKVTTRLLERQGMEVMAAKDGVEAMSLLGERTPDVLLLDIEMPRMDGFEVARQIRHDTRMADLPIIMISSRTGQKHQDHARSLGINRFLGKPFQESELLTAIEQLAERR